MARARKRASERYRVAVEEFVAAATAEGPHLLLLDKRLGENSEIGPT